MSSKNTSITGSNGSRNDNRGIVHRTPAATTAAHPNETVTLAGQPGPNVTPAAAAATFHDERDDVIGVINELEEQLDRYERNRVAAERTLAEANDRLSAAGQRAQELEWQIVTLQTRLESLEQVQREAAILEERIGELNQKSQVVTQQLSEAQAENTRLVQELKRSEKQVQELWLTRKERDALRGEVIAAEARLTEQQRLIEELTGERNYLQSGLREAHSALEEMRAARIQLETTARTFEERSRVATQVADALNEKLEASRLEKKNLIARITHLEREIARTAELRQTQESEIATLRHTNRASETALAGIKKAFNEVRVALAETTARTRRRSTLAWPRAATTLRTGESASDAIGIVGDVDSQAAVAREIADIATASRGSVGSTLGPGANTGYSFSNNAPTAVEQQIAGMGGIPSA